MVAVIGGAKVTDKIRVIENFLKNVDTILIGGAMTYPFLKSQGHEIGASLARTTSSTRPAGCSTWAPKSRLPVDLVVGDDFEAGTRRRDLDGVDIPDGWIGMDIGPKTSEAYGGQITSAGSVVWNGPMGTFEHEPFAAGTPRRRRGGRGRPGTTVVGGGDSAAALTEFGLADRVTHLSTGGGASLELIEGKTLPGVEVLS